MVVVVVVMVVVTGGGGGGGFGLYPKQSPLTQKVTEIPKLQVLKNYGENAIPISKVHCS